MIPSQIKHQVMSIFDKIKPPAPDGDIDKAKFINAWNISFNRALQYGYITVIGGSDLENSIRLTQKGAENEVKHNGPKAARFDIYFEKYGQFIG